MHYLMLITFARLPREKSPAARSRAYNLLGDDDSFCGEGGRFGSPVCDWFVIGGRWSGHLSKALIADAYRAELKQQFPQLTGDYYKESDVKEHTQALDALWHRHGGSGPSPFNRSSYEHLGYDDDAMRVDRSLYDRFLAEFRGEYEHRENSYRCTFADLDGEEVDETFIGRKWIAVVDYHN